MGVALYEFVFGTTVRDTLDLLQPDIPLENYPWIRQIKRE